MAPLIVPRTNYKKLDVLILATLGLFLWLFHTISLIDNVIFVTLAVAGSITCVIVLFLAFPSYARLVHRLLIIVAYMVAVFVVQSFLPIVAGPDEQVFLSQVAHLSLRELLDAWVVGVARVQPVSSTVVFPALVQLLGGKLAGTVPGTIAILNGFVWILATTVWTNAVGRFGGIGIPRTESGTRQRIEVLYALMLLSPTAIYWSAVYAKDIFAVSVSIFAAVTLLNRRYLLGVFFLLLAASLRIYSPVAVLSFYAFLKRSQKLSFTLFVGSLTLIYLLTNSFSTVGNTFIAAIYGFISPDPTNVSNWKLVATVGQWTYSPMLLAVEGVFLGISLAVGASFIIINRQRHRYLMLFVLIATVASALVMVGFRVILIRGRPYGIGTFGDNILRKKTVFWPLVMTWCALTLGEVQDLIVSWTIKRRVDVGRIVR